MTPQRLAEAVLKKIPSKKNITRTRREFGGNELLPFRNGIKRYVI